MSSLRLVLVDVTFLGTSTCLIIEDLWQWAELSPCMGDHLSLKYRIYATWNLFSSSDFHKFQCTRSVSDGFAGGPCRPKDFLGVLSFFGHQTFMELVPSGRNRVLVFNIGGHRFKSQHFILEKLLADTWWFTVRNLDQLICTGSSTHKLPVAICHNIKQKINLNPWRNMPVCTTGVSDCFQAMISVPNCWLCGLHL